MKCQPSDRVKIKRVRIKPSAVETSNLGFSSSPSSPLAPFSGHHLFSDCSLILWMMYGYVNMVHMTKYWTLFLGSCIQ